MYNYQQSGQQPPYGQGQPQQQQQGYQPNQQYGGGQPGYGQPGQDQGYGAPPSGGAMDGLAQGMAGMGIQDGGAGAGAPARHGRKKKDRHAHHELDQQPGATGAPQGFSPSLGGGVAPNTPSMMDPSSQGFGGQPLTPGLNQYSAPGVGQQFGGGQRAPPADSAMDMGGPSSTGRVDPEQIPSIPRARDAAELYYREHMYLTMEQHVPPPAAVPYVSFDQGNSSPRHARLTLNSIPASSDALSQTALPLGLVLQPFAAPAEGEQAIPVLDYKEIGPPRCRRCRAYINPFMQFKAGGNKFVCNMCTFPNDVAQDYFAPTDPTGVRVDRNERPELRLGTVEFVVPKEYWAYEPVSLRWLFVIDAGMEAVQKGTLSAMCRGILESLYGESEEAGEGEEPKVKRVLPEGCKVGFVTFDRDVHFYNCQASRQQAEMMIMPDVEEPFLPLGTDGLFSDPYESKHVIEKLLTQLPEMFSQPKPEPVLLPALTSALGALEKTGGKIICSISSLPTYGPGKLLHRDTGKLHGIDTEKKLFQTESQPWRKLASDMVKNGVGVDFFLTAPGGGGYMDIATIGHVSAQSGGEMFYYPNWHAPRDTMKISKEIKHVLTRETGYQAVLKVRCSNGLQVSAYHGNFVQHAFGADLEFGTIDADKAVGVMFSYDGKLDPKLDAHFQSALLYTTATGERRVRCTNTVASVNEGGGESMRFIDQDAVVSMIAKEAATRMTERTLKEIRGAVTEKTIDILAGYRKAFSRVQPSGQLVLPENLKEFGMYTLSLLKSKAFKAGAEPSDKRTHVMRLIKSASPLTLSLLLYPRVYALHTLEPEWGFPDANTGHLIVPPSLRASFSRIEEGGAYLVDDGQTCLLWLHAQVSPNLLEDLFGGGFDSLQALDANMTELPVLDTHLNAQVRNLISYWATTRGSRAMSLQLARQGLDGAEYEFARLLLEDRNAEAQSYVDWLVHIHRGVQGELSGQRKKDSGEGGGGIDAMAGLRAMGW